MKIIKQICLSVIEFLITAYVFGGLSFLTVMFFKCNFITGVISAIMLIISLIKVEISL